MNNSISNGFPGIKHSCKSVKKPKLAHFKMGKQGKKYNHKRLTSATLQTVNLNGKAFILTVDQVVSHSNGVITGSVFHYGTEYKVSLVRNETYKVRNTIHGKILQPILSEPYWIEVKSA